MNIEYEYEYEYSVHIEKDDCAENLIEMRFRKMRTTSGVTYIMVSNLLLNHVERLALVLVGGQRLLRLLQPLDVRRKRLMEGFNGLHVTFHLPLQSNDTNYRFNYILCGHIFS